MFPELVERRSRQIFPSFHTRSPPALDDSRLTLSGTRRDREMVEMISARTEGPVEEEGFSPIGPS